MRAGIDPGRAIVVGRRHPSVMRQADRLHEVPVVIIGHDRALDDLQLRADPEQRIELHRLRIVRLVGIVRTREAADDDIDDRTCRQPRRGVAFGPSDRNGLSLWRCRRNDRQVAIAVAPKELRTDREGADREQCEHGGDGEESERRPRRAVGPMAAAPILIHRLWREGERRQSRHPGISTRVNV